MLLREPAGTPWWAAAVPDFRAAEPPAGFAGQWLFTAPTADMAFYLDWLVTRLTDLGGVLLRRRLDRLADSMTVPGGPPALVVNATGLAAGVLAADPAVHPVRGTVVLVANPGMEMSTSIRDETNPAGVTYVHPRGRDVVLGGTFEPDQDDTTPDERVGRAIVARCVDLEPALAGAPVLGQLVGLRPARRGGVRVATDPVGLPGGTRLIHNYGHGGAGVTLAWGCADEVVALAG
jgi:D-amino-acid oxidase